MTREERLRVFAEGKANLRVYDSPGCIICRQVVPAIGKFVDNNRRCIVYEKLHYFDHTAELKSIFDLKQGLEFPLVVVEGRRGTYKANGYVSTSLISSYVVSASGCDIR